MRKLALTLAGAGAALAQQAYYIYPDHLNTPRAIENQALQLVWRWENRDPFGANLPDENPSGLGNFTCNLRLPGQYFDVETAYHYNYFRDYAPETGRYIQSDPIGLKGGMNTFGYVNGSPISKTDRRGLQVICAPGLLCAVVPPAGSNDPNSTSNNTTSSAEIIPFPGSRERPTERPSRTSSSQTDECPDPMCYWTRISTFESTGTYANLLTCQYKCPTKGIRYLSNTVHFDSENPGYLCEPAVPEYYFPW